MRRPQFLPFVALLVTLSLATVAGAKPPVPPRVSPAVAAHTAASMPAAKVTVPPGPSRSQPPRTISVVVHNHVVQVAAPAPEAVAITSSPQLVLGVPKTSSVKISGEVLLDKGSYVVSYNPLRNEPNWVSWHLDRHSVLVSVPETRSNRFRGDDDLPDDVYHVVPHDYLHSGFDMGHMIPSDDRSRVPSQNADTFLMTNMTPQRAALNRGPWKYLENYQRKLVTDQGKEIEVMAGPIFSDRPKKIGNGVAIPSSYFKIAVVHDKGKDVGTSAEVIAVIMPNSTTVADTKWTKFLVTPRDIEQATGCEFFTNLSPEVRTALLDKKAEIQIETVGAPPR